MNLIAYAQCSKHFISLSLKPASSLFYQTGDANVTWNIDYRHECSARYLVRITSGYFLSLLRNEPILLETAELWNTL